MQLINEFYPLLSQPKQIVITMHQKPDGDAMGSTLGLYHFLHNRGHQVTVISPTNWADFLEWLPGIETVINFEGHREKSLAILDKADISILFRL
jgi:phosphoesterase RecJ-like protein